MSMCENFSDMPEYCI